VAATRNVAGTMANSRSSAPGRCFRAAARDAPIPGQR